MESSLQAQEHIGSARGGYIVLHPKSFARLLSCLTNPASLPCPPSSTLPPSRFPFPCPSSVCREVRGNTLLNSHKRLGVEMLTREDVQRMPWEQMELKISAWMHYMKIGVRG